MKELSPDASELVYAGREAFRPNEVDRARVLAAITGAATLASGAALAGSAELSATGLRGLSRLTRLWRLSVVTVPMVVGGALVWRAAAHHPAEPSVVSAVARPALVQAPSEAAPAATPVEETPVKTAPSVTLPERPAAPVIDSAKPTAQISLEVALLSKAQAELSRGRAQQALEALNEHARRFPRGALTEERMATRARALCALGRNTEAQAELTRVERLNRGSAYLARAREACGTP